jgi:hypothetical protein
VISVYTGTRVDRLTLVGRALPEYSNFTAARLTLSASAGVEYRIQIDGSGTTEAGPFQITLNRPPPVNDAFASATAIDGEAGIWSGMNVGARSEAGEPIHAGTGDGYSIWFRWTAPRSGRFRFDTEGREINSVLAVYAGSAVDGLTHVASNESHNGLYGAASRVFFDATAGTVYRIAVDGNDTGGSLKAEGEVVLNWQFVPPPPNDHFAAAQPISGLSGSVTGSTYGATREPFEPPHAYEIARNSVWYRYTPAFDGAVYFSVDEDWKSRIAIYAGTSLALLTSTGGMRAGITYYIAVDSTPARNAGPFVLRWEKQPPYNDDFGHGNIGPFRGRTDGGTIRQTNVAATPQAGEPSHAGVASPTSVWYDAWIPAPGTLELDTVGSDFDTAVAVYEGEAVHLLTAIAADDDSGGGGASRLRVHLGVGRVHFAVAGKNGAFGNLVVNWTFVGDRPVNDQVAAAQVIGGRTGFVRGTTYGATREAAEPDHLGDAAGNSVWYRWVAPEAGLAVFDTFDVEPVCDFCPDDTDFDSIVAVYRGATPASLTLVAANDDTGLGGDSQVAFPVLPGESYYLALDGDRTSDTLYPDDHRGSLALNWALHPENAQFAHAQVLNGLEGRVDGWAGDPSHRGLLPAVWYRWRAPASGDVAFELTDSTDLTQLEIFTGGSVETLQKV